MVLSDHVYVQSKASEQVVWQSRQHSRVIKMATSTETRHCRIVQQS